MVVGQKVEVYFEHLLGMWRIWYLVVGLYSSWEMGYWDLAGGSGTRSGKYVTIA